jgi:hypothetical protein
MSATISIAGAVRPLWARFVRWFFANFFQLLIAAVSLSQWGVLWWLAGPRQGAIWPIHVAGPSAIYAINRQLIVRPRRLGVERLPRLYYAVAFTCLFCGAFLLLNGVVWTTAKLFLGALTVEALGTTAHQGAASSLDSTFRWLARLGVGGIMFSFAYGYSIGQLRLRITRLPLRLRHFGSTLDGLRIAQVSDIHIGLNLDAAQLERFVARLSSLQPDLICITGDIADSANADLASFLPILGRLQAPHGVFAILGNHDHYAGADRVVEALRRHTHFTILRDEVASIEIRGQRVHVIGLDDRGRDWARGLPAVPQLTELLATLPSDEPKLLLCHRPDVFEQAAAADIALTLSGHTHGGQLALPWFGGRYRNLAEFITAFDRGLYERDGCFLYVNCGLGVTGQRIRLCTPREISVVEVRSAASLQAA